VHPPRLLVVDELSLGLAPIIIDDVYRNLVQLREQGVTLIVVEQQVEHALELADRVVVLSRGEISYDGAVVPVEELAPHFLPDPADHTGMTR
jgi:ABC-type branched-subunit amino acid transport system ATPase component